MSNSIDKEVKVVKKGLGRGLGSLLGENSPNYLEEVEVPDLEKAHGIQKAKSSLMNENQRKSESLTAGVRNQSPPAAVLDSNRVWQIDIAKIYANKKQPRKFFDKQGLEELSLSIKEKGIIQPILVRKKADNQYEIIAGERRWRAAQKAGLHQVPAIIKEYDTQNALEIALIENIQRQDLNPIEEAEAYQQLMVNYSLTQQQLADKMGKERATLANKIRLLNLPGEIRDLIKEEKLSTGHAKLILSLDEKEHQLKAAREIVGQQLTVKDADKLINKIKKGFSEKVDAEESLKNELVQGVAEELKKLLGTKVTIDYNSKSKGKIAIHFYSDLEFNSIIDGIRKSWQK